MIGELSREALRYTVLGATVLLPVQQRVRIDRWMRGREEYRKLQRADWVLMSWGKSGRTWLRVMLSRYYQVRFGLPPRSLLNFDNLHHMDSRVPRVFFTHNNYIRNYTGHWDSKKDYYDKRAVLLVRDPRDVAVSQYFQWKFRMRPWKKRINDYPLHGKEVSVFEFMMDSRVGLPRVVAYFNEWAAEMPRIPGLHLVRYEDMRTEPARVLTGILDFTGTPGSSGDVEEAVEFASYDNMKKLEERSHFRFSGARVTPGDRDNPNSFKVRRAKVGGYRDYFDDEQVTEIDRFVNRRLHPVFGYGTESAGPTDAERPAAGS